MADGVSKKKRSEIMRAVKSRNTKIEIIFREAFWKKGFKYRKNSAKYFGKPDLVLKKYKTVIFIDSCFWHGCKKHFRMPSTNRQYWKNKIKMNITRDKEVNKYYKKAGWKNFRIWEHEIKKNPEKALEKIIKFLKNK